MALVVRPTRYCDVCDVVATRVITVTFDGKAQWGVDACDAHAKPIEEFARKGRRVMDRGGENVQVRTFEDLRRDP